MSLWTTFIGAIDTSYCSPECEPFQTTRNSTFFYSIASTSLGPNTLPFFATIYFTI